MSELYLFARIAETAVAIRTEEIEAVVRLSELSPVPGVSGHVAGLSALRSRVLTIIDATAVILGTPPITLRPDDEASYAIVCDISGHSYGILVDGVDDIRTVQSAALPICGRLSDAWESYAKGVIEDEGQSYFILSLSSFLDQTSAAQAA